MAHTLQIMSIQKRYCERDWFIVTVWSLCPVLRRQSLSPSNIHVQQQRFSNHRVELLSSGNSKTSPTMANKQARGNLRILWWAIRGSDQTVNKLSTCWKKTSHCLELIVRRNCRSRGPCLNNFTCTVIWLRKTPASQYLYVTLVEQHKATLSPSV